MVNPTINLGSTYHGRGPWTESGEESELSTSAHLSLLPDCGSNVTGCLSDVLPLSNKAPCCNNSLTFTKVDTSWEKRVQMPEPRAET